MVVLFGDVVDVVRVIVTAAQSGRGGGRGPEPRGGSRGGGGDGVGLRDGDEAVGGGGAS
jgi:hypothetical protein